MEALSFSVIAVLGLIVYKLLDFFKYVVNKNWNGALTILIGWAAGIIGIFLFASSTFGSQLQIGEGHHHPLLLGSLDPSSKVILGMAATNLLAVFYDAKKAVDGSDSAKTPKLIKKH